jgi:hypothetical protein
LALYGLIWLTVGIVAFRWFNYRARADGLYDRTTDY